MTASIAAPPRSTCRFVFLALFQLGIAVQERINLVGHLALLYLLANILQGFLTLLGVVIAPLGEIQARARRARRWR